MSLSSRRAWIEISGTLSIPTLLPVALLAESVDWNMILSIWCILMPVALLAESVDWNNVNQITISQYERSLSSRRAWIEIQQTVLMILVLLVALLAESVDWNIVETLTHQNFWWCRSPRGERGLKYIVLLNNSISKAVALLAESVDWNSLHIAL